MSAGWRFGAQLGLAVLSTVVAVAEPAGAQKRVIYDFSDEPILITSGPNRERHEREDHFDDVDTRGGGNRPGSRPGPRPRPDAPERAGQTNGRSADGSYTGAWSGDKPEGVGTKQYQDGSRYQGSWKQGEQEGQGTLTARDGRVVYEGEWSKGVRSGQGAFTKADGLSYRGSWSNDLPNGRGQMRDPQAGFEYVGDFAGRRFTGWGHVRYTGPAETLSYTARFDTRRDSNSGTVLYRGGRSYIGNLASGRPDGEGVQIDVTGEVTRGQWVAGKPDGRMIRVDLRGQALASEWSQGRLVSAEVPLEPAAQVEFAQSFQAQAVEDVRDSFDAVEHRFTTYSQFGLIDPVYTQPEQWMAHEALASAMTQAAGHVLAASEDRSAGSAAALSLIRNAYEVARFAEGFASGGLNRTFVAFKDGAVETWETVVELARDPRHAVDAVIEIYEAVSSPAFTDAVGSFLADKWTQFAAAGAYQQGDMARTLVDQLMVQAAGGGAVGLAAGGISKASRLTDSLRRLAAAARGHSGELLKARLRFLTEGLGARRDAVELMSRGRVVEAASSAQYELLKADLRVREIFTASGGLTENALAGSREIIPGSALGDPRVIAELTRDGSKIADWAKHTTQTYDLSGKRVSVHFYRHRSGRVNLDVDYKVIVE